MERNPTANSPSNNNYGENGLSKAAYEIDAVFSIVNATLSSRACDPRKLPDDIGHLVSH
jgi:hypothetical protein